MESEKFDADINFISFISNDNSIIHINKNDIINNNPVLCHLLNLTGVFADEPDVDNDNIYRIFETLNRKSIILLMKCMVNEINDDIREFVRGMERKDFYDAVDFGDTICIMIPHDLFHNVMIPPMTQKDDIYKEYQFIKQRMNYDSVHEIRESNTMLEKLLENNWIIVDNYEIKDHNGIMISNTVTMRKKIDQN